MQAKYKLILNPGTADEQVLPIRGSSVTIGRAPETDIYLLHQSLSRRHARLDTSDGQLTLVDLKSKNGTFVNGLRIAGSQLLEVGDTFRCGEVVFRLAGGAVPRSSESRGELTPIAVHDFSELSSLSIEDLLADDTQSSSSALKVKATDSAERARHKLRILLKVSEVLASPGTIDSLLERILDLVFQILDVDRAALLLREASGELRPRVVKSLVSADDSGHFYSENIVNYVREHRVAALFSDALVDPRVDASASILRQSISTALCVPIKQRAELLGVLYMDNRRVPNRFSEEDLDFVSAFANQASIAIENSMLSQRIQEEDLLRNAYRRFFSPTTLRRLELSRGASLGVSEAEVTTLFADISDFTGLSSRLRPTAVVDMLNEYFPVMSEIVFRNEGTLEKYIGDALMAVWGTPFQHEDDADRAVRAAVEMQRALVGLNARWRARGQAEIQIHIGLNSGRVAAGNIGSEAYLQYTTIGDATNVASRLCGAAGPREILLSESTFERLKSPPCPLDPYPPVRVKGKPEPLPVRQARWGDS